MMQLGFCGPLGSEAEAKLLEQAAVNAAEAAPAVPAPAPVAAEGPAQAAAIAPQLPEGVLSLEATREGLERAEQVHGAPGDAVSDELLKSWEHPTAGLGRRSEMVDLEQIREMSSASWHSSIEKLGAGLGIATRLPVRLAWPGGPWMLSRPEYRAARVDERLGRPSDAEPVRERAAKAQAALPDPRARAWRSWKRVRGEGLEEAVR